MGEQDHYIGIDVGTGSARACLIDSSGDIKALASEAIKLWQPQQGYYVRLLQAPPLLLYVDQPMRHPNLQSI